MLSTSKDNVPSFGVVDAFFDGECFYVVSHRLSRKVAEIEGNPNVSLCGRRMHSFSGRARSIGHPSEAKNASVRGALAKAFESWHFKHNDEPDENMCSLRIDPTTGFFHKDGTGYRVDFAAGRVEAFPFAFDTVLAED